MKDIFSFLSSSNLDIQTESMKALSNLFQDGKASFDPNYAQLIFDFVKLSPDLKLRVESIRLLGSICLNG